MKETIKTSIVWATTFCLLFGLGTAFFSHEIMLQFTKNDMEMIRVGELALRVNGVSFIFFGFYTVYSFLFLVIGKAREGFFLGACRQGICFMPVMLIFPNIMGLNGIIFAQPVADILSAIITIFMAYHLHENLDKAQEELVMTGQ